MEQTLFNLEQTLNNSLVVSKFMGLGVYGFGSLGVWEFGSLGVMG